MTITISRAKKGENETRAIVNWITKKEKKIKTIEKTNEQTIKKSKKKTHQKEKKIKQQVEPADGRVSEQASK